MSIQTTPPNLNANKVKKFFSCSMASIFSDNIHVQSKYSSEDIVNTIRNAITNKMYIETYARNYNTIHTPSVVRTIYYLDSYQVEYNGVV